MSLEGAEPYPAADTLTTSRMMLFLASHRIVHNVNIAVAQYTYTDTFAATAADTP